MTSADDLSRALIAVANCMDANRDMLCALDGEIGDADHGIAMSEGFGAVRAALADTPATPTAVFNTAAKAFLNAVGASSGPLYATAFMRAGAAVKGQDALDDAQAPTLIAAMVEGITHRGKASVGDKTMLDAWHPAAEAALAATGRPFAEVFADAAEAAQAGAEDTKTMQAQLGRSARLGERSVGHMDPGAVSAALLLRAMADSFAKAG